MTWKRLTDKQIGEAPNRFYRGCAGKKRWPSKRSAGGVARVTNDGAVPYKCKFCKGWHTGH